MKLKKKDKIIEQNVLKNYKIHSPSKLPIEKLKYKKSYEKKRERLFLNALKLPQKIFDNADLLDLGSGTGEHDLLYAKWNANLHLVEINPISVNQTKEYFKKNKLESKIKLIKNQSIFDFKTKKRFDIIISEGVLHHTNAPFQGLEKIAKLIKRGGFCVLQLAFDTSHFQRSLHRLIIDYLKKKEPNLDVINICKKLFNETINRAAKFGGRTKNQIIYDFYTNPKHKGINLEKLINFFKKNNFEYYSSYPSIEPEGFVNGLESPLLSEIISNYSFLSLTQNMNFVLASKEDKYFIKEIQKDLIALNKLWSKLMINTSLSDYEYKNKNNFKIFKNKKEFRKFFIKYNTFLSKRNAIRQKHFKTFSQELSSLIESLKKNNIKNIKNCIKKTKILFKGYNGVPSNYIVFYKK